MGRYFDAIASGRYNTGQIAKPEEQVKPAPQMSPLTDNPIFAAVEQLNPLAFGGDVIRAFDADNKFADVIDPYSETRKIREEKYPVASTIGEIAGALVGGAGVAKGLTKGAIKYLPKFGAKLAAGSPLAAGAVEAVGSGLTGTAMRAAESGSRGEGLGDTFDPSRLGLDVALGGLFGAGGQKLSNVMKARKGITPAVTQATEEIATETPKLGTMQFGAGKRFKPINKQLKEAELAYQEGVGDIQNLYGTSDVQGALSDRVALATGKRVPITAQEATETAIKESGVDINKLLDDLYNAETASPFPTAAQARGARAAGVTSQRQLDLIQDVRAGKLLPKVDIDVLGNKASVVPNAAIDDAGKPLSQHIDEALDFDTPAPAGTKPDFAAAEITKGKALKGVKNLGEVEYNFKDAQRLLRDIGTTPETKTYIAKNIIDPLNTSKGTWGREVKQVATDIQKALKNTGLKATDDEAMRAVTWIGEGRKQGDAFVKKGQEVFKDIPYSRADLINDFGATKAAQIEKASNTFRQYYDNMIDEINEVRVAMKKNPIPKEKNYFHHMQTDSELQRFTDMFDSPAGVASDIKFKGKTTGVEERMFGFKKKRGQGTFEDNAYKAMMSYIPQAKYAKNIDPMVLKFKNFTKDLSKVKDTDVSRTVKWLSDYTDRLAGVPTGMNKSLVNSRAFGFLNFVNNRAKSNAVLGNLASALIQPVNIANAAGELSPTGMLKGFKSFLNSSRGNIDELSDFINERYIDEVLDKDIIGNTKRFAKNIMTTMDKLGTEFIWTARFEDDIAKGLSRANAAKSADEFTRRMVGGRGIGDVSKIQDNKLYQVLAPFQLEVANAWYVLQDQFKNTDTTSKALKQVMKILVANTIMNSAIEPLTGRRILFDPIDASYEALTNEEATASQRGGRILGEVLGNVPLAPQVVNQFMDRRQSEEFFGEADPTRFGTGLLAAEAIKDPLTKLLPSFGGQQLKKTFQGAEALQRGGDYDARGQLRTPLQDPNLLEALQMLTMGKYANPEVGQYFEEDRRPLSTEQELQMKTSQDPQAYYNKLLQQREIDTQRRAVQQQQNDRKQQLLRERINQLGKGGL